MSMDAPVDGELIELEESGVRVLVVARGRRGPGTDAVLRRLVAGGAGVPADDVELVHACEVCGARHGRPVVAYPTTPSGGAWFADAAVSGDAIVAAAGTRHPVGVGIESAVVGFDEVIDEAAFHTSELAVLAELDPAAAPAGPRRAVGAQVRAPPCGGPHRVHRTVDARGLGPRR